MSVKQIGLSALVGLLCNLGGLQAQQPAAGPGGQDVLPLYTPFGGDAPSPYNPVTSGAGAGGPLASSFEVAPAGTTPEGVALDEGSPPPPPYTPIPLGLPASPYLHYPHAPCCCGPVGKCGGPIGSEVFIRSGIFFPVGGGIFNQYLQPGWDIEGGGRLLLFNQSSTAAWTGTLSISNMYAQTGSANQAITLYRVPIHTLDPTTQTAERVQYPELSVTVRSLNLTFVNMGFGREWWLHGSADPGQQKGWNWRCGCDFGGRWGSGKVQFNEIQHLTGVVGGMYGAIHSDVECPFRCGILFAGVRLEYNYIWTSLLQDQNDGDFSTINLLFQMGVRF
ncbi:MAG TPA: hypothetical protein VMG10_01555 [Gemmataceae bacterium]|nr:hypothetical protein [Gemmataceae bacterium]